MLTTYTQNLYIFPELTSLEVSSRLKEEFLKLLREDIEFRYAVLGLLGIDEILKRIDENTKAIRSLQEQVKSLQEQVKNLQEQVRDLQEQVKRHGEILERHSKVLEEHSKAIEKLTSKIDALGTCWGIVTEETFRESIKYLVQDLLKVYKVDKWIYYDKDGYVYGYPSWIEIDVLIKDTEHILVEFKSHADRADMAELYKIGQLYEKVTGVKPKLLMVASTIRKRAKELADKMGIECRETILEY